MAQDSLKNRREKSKYILELRYDHEPLVQAFDRRGKVLEVIHAAFKTKMKHWKAHNVLISIADDIENPRKIVQIGHQKTSIMYEDPASRQEFLDDSSKLIKLMQEVFPEAPKSLSRLGFRSLSVLSCEKAKNIGMVFASVRNAYLKDKLPVEVTPSDCAVTLLGDSVRLMIGPAGKDEDWVRANFKFADDMKSEFGIGLDVDCFAADLSIGETTSLHKAFVALHELAAKIEIDAISGLIE